jgi:type II secretion system protein H
MNMHRAHRHEEGRSAIRHAAGSPPERDAARPSGFTLVEIMVVVAIMGVILTMGVPSIFRAIRREGMRKAVNDVVEICSNARARAILSGEMTEVVFHPNERRLEVSGAAPAQPAQATSTADLVAGKPTGASSLLSAKLPPEISIQMLDINLLEYRESESAKVRFFPNGTSDELRLVLVSNKGEQRGIELEICTGLASVVPDIQVWLTR